MSFGARLKGLRVGAGLTQGQLARKCGLSDAYINQIETARTDPPNHQVCRTLGRALAADERELWKSAFTARLEKWLKKEGFRAPSPEFIAAFFDGLSKKE